MLGLELIKKLLSLKNIIIGVDNFKLGKKKLNKVVSSFKIDEIYDIAIKSGAVGGKLLGAGGGGYFLFYALKKDHKKIIHKLKFLKNIPFDFESMGTQKFKI